MTAPYDPTPLLQEGDDAYDQGAYDRAMLLGAEIERAARQLPEDPQQRRIAAAGVALALRAASRADLDQGEAFDLRAGVLLDSDDLDDRTRGRLLDARGQYRAITRRYDAARECYEAALAAKERAVGPESPELFESLLNLAALRYFFGKPSEAEPLFARGQRLLDAHGDAISPRQQVTFANNAGFFAAQLGRYAEAAEALQRAYRQAERLLGADHSRTLEIAANLAQFWSDLGMYDDARDLLESVLERQQQTGRGGTELGFTHQALSRVWLIGLDDPAKAEAHLREAIPLLAEHNDIAHCSLRLVDIALAQGDRTEARAAIDRLIAAYSDVDDPTHRRIYGEALLRQGRLHALEGDPDAAIAAYAAAVEIARDAYEVGNIELLEPLTAYAQALGREGRHMEAAAIAREALEGIPVRIFEIFQNYAEGDQRRFLESHDDLLDIVLTAVRQDPDDARVEEAWRGVLFRKGMILRMALVQRALHRRDPGLAEDYQRLADIRSELARVHQAADRHQTADALERERRSLERTISAKVLAKGAGDDLLQPDLPRITAAIPGDTALIDCFRYRDGALDGESCYALFLVLRGGPVQVIFLPAKKIDRGIQLLRDTVNEYLLTPSHWNRKDAVDGYRQLARKLHALVAEPIQTALPGKEHWLISADGALLLFPWGLFLGDGGYLEETKRLEYITHPAALLVGDRSPNTAPAAVFADPDFGEQSFAVKLKDYWRRFLGRMGLRTRGIREPGERFHRIPYTKRELAALRQLFLDDSRSPTPLTLEFTGKRATVEHLRQVRSPQVLHIATHGFFLGDRDFAHVGVHRHFHPFCSTGLAFAGANDSPEGIISALEIAELDLTGTELVVLSACDTGVGDYASGEGVFSLWRAFKYAGARKVLCSLWQVSDRETASFMESFYAMLARKVEPDVAATMARRQLREAVEAADPNAHPALWGAFVVVR